jgi:hypothetical protein
MLDTSAIRMRAEPGRGEYESFYFRGTSEDGNHAFWLKHNLLRYDGSGDVWLEGALILFDRPNNRTAAVYSHTAVDAERFARMHSDGKDWEHVGLELRNGSSIQIRRHLLAGRMSGEGGDAQWDLQVHRSNMALVPYPSELMYRLPLPRNKVLTHDCHVDFKGSVSAGDLAFSGVFRGMNGHNWGTGHAHEYAYANCAEFSSQGGCYFDGFSARIALGGIVTPRLSMGSLYVGGQWHHFNSLLRAARHAVRRLDDYCWRAELRNSSHTLEIDIDGATPATLPWATLHYENPDRTRSVVRNTKFATLKLRLRNRAGELEEELSSKCCELETLLAHNVPNCSGYIGEPMEVMPSTPGIRPAGD